MIWLDGLLLGIALGMWIERALTRKVERQRAKSAAWDTQERNRD